MNKQQRDDLSSLAKNRIDEMKELRYEKHRSLQDIANQFGISRERVRQLIGNSGRYVLGRTDKHVYKPRFVNKNYGTTYEQKAFLLLGKLGFQCQMMGIKHPFDILVNGKKRIDVKGTAKPILVNGYPYYNIHVKAKEKEACDYFLVVAEDKTFVIPFGDVRGKNQILISPTKKSVYENRFDFLEEE